MTSDVTDLLDALRNGTASLDEVARHFRERKWPRPARPKPQTYLEMAAAEVRDPEPFIPGSFDEVTAAYHSGNLSDEQYEVLARAMAEAKAAPDADA